MYYSEKPVLGLTKLYTSDPSQMKMTFHFFPKSGVLRKNSLTL